MNWILIAVIHGSIITSTHETKEACEGRAFIIREALSKKVATKCVENPTTSQYLTYGGQGTTLSIVPNGLNTNQ